MSAADGADAALTRLEETVLGGARRHDRAAVQEATGASQEHLERLWRAMGFPDVPGGAVAFTDGDVAAVRALDALDLGATDPGTAGLAVQTARTLGQSAARLAADHVRLAVAADRAAGAAPDPAEMQTRAEVLLPVVERLLVHVWRRHLAAAVGDAAGVSRPGEPQQTAVVFADLVGYTSLTRRLDPPALESLLERFEAEATDRASRLGGQVVKTLGDEVMIVCGDVRAAARIALETVAAHAADDALPEVRAGLALGPVLRRVGDVFGEPVNIAARVTALARPGTVLADRAAAEVLDGDEGVNVVRVRGRQDVRGYGHLQVSVLRPRAA